MPTPFDDTEGNGLLPLFSPILHTPSTNKIFVLRNFYHQGLRKAISGPADAFVDRVLGLRRGTLVSRYLRLLLAFSLSGAIHGVAEVASGVRSADRGHFLFFTIQAFAIMFEDLVQFLYRRAGSPLPTFLARLIGYCWVIAWHLNLGSYVTYSVVMYGDDPSPSKLAPVLKQVLGF